MGGRDTTRGIFLQALVGVLGALQNDNVWASLALEPDLEAEKVDIIWHYPNGDKVVQVKSSQNQINVPDAKKWTKELVSSYDAKNYELILIGPCSDGLSKRQTYENVAVPSPKPLDIQCLLGYTAHCLAAYLENQEKSAGEALTRENVVLSLIGKLQEDSIQGQVITRDDFENLLNRWVQDAFNKEKRPSRIQLERLKERIKGHLEKTDYIRNLYYDHPDTKTWHDTILRYIRELDEFFPKDGFEDRRANINWQDHPDMPVTPEGHLRGCNQTEGLLKDALQKIQEELDCR
jgi:hypothetical protein